MPALHVCVPSTHAPTFDPQASVEPFGEQAASTQTPDEQMPDAQSLSPLHDWLVMQSGHDPPQSTSLSSPFFMPSPQPANTQTPPAHSPDAQSLGTVHIEPSLQAGHTPPPQSISLSLPFFTPSEHVAV